MTETGFHGMTDAELAAHNDAAIRSWSVRKCFYDLSGGMESAAMLVIDRERIRQTRAIVRWADTGVQKTQELLAIWTARRDALAKVLSESIDQTGGQSR